MNNKEVKDLLILNLLCIIVFIIIAFVSGNFLYKEYKQEQIENNSYIVGNLISKYPELESEIISSIVLNENHDIGYETLEKYGLTNLDTMSYNENIKNVIVKNNLTLVILGLISLFIINILFVRNCYKKINKIDKYMNNILNDDYSLNINEYCEGDISNLKNDVYKVTIKLKEQSEMLQKEKQYLEELLEDISHQIKTPLTSMYMINDILETEKDENIKKDFLTKNKNQIERIKWLISSLLKLSRLDSGTIKLKSEKIKVSSLISKAIEPIKVLIELKKINVKLNIKNTDVIVDVNWTSEALLNIIKNACEHTKDEIIIESTTNPIFTEIRITDNGKGIDKNDLPHIFERFYKGSHNKDSIGIGLNMSKKIIEMQNGTIEVEVTDKTTFIIKLFKNFL